MGLGALAIVGIAFMLWFVLSWSYNDNKRNAEKEAWRKAKKWNWD